MPRAPFEVAPLRLLCPQYLAHVLNHGKAEAPFMYQHKGSLAYVGSWLALGDFTGVANVTSDTKWRGLPAWFLWRSVYLTKLGLWRNRLQVPFDWLKTMTFGRDTTHF